MTVDQLLKVNNAAGRVQSVAHFVCLTADHVNEFIGVLKRERWRQLEKLKNGKKGQRVKTTTAQKLHIRGNATERNAR